MHYCICAPARGAGRAKCINVIINQIARVQKRVHLALIQLHCNDYDFDLKKMIGFARRNPCGDDNESEGIESPRARARAAFFNFCTCNNVIGKFGMSYANLFCDHPHHHQKKKTPPLVCVFFGWMDLDSAVAARDEARRAFINDFSVFRKNKTLLFVIRTFLGG